MNRFSRERIEECYLKGIVNKNQPAVRIFASYDIVRYLQYQNLNHTSKLAHLG